MVEFLPLIKAFKEFSIIFENIRYPINPITAPTGTVIKVTVTIVFRNVGNTAFKDPKSVFRKVPYVHRIIKKIENRSNYRTCNQFIIFKLFCINSNKV